MNPAQLLTHFDRISEAPDAVPRLRRFILDLAMRGKLVEQDPRDEPASELLKRIETEKERLVKAGDMRRQVEVPQVAEAESPFEIPASWHWVHLIDVLTKLTDGTHHSPTNLADGAFKYITAKNIKPEGVSLADVSYVTAKVHREIYARCNPENGDILYIKDGATTGIVTINDLDEPFSMLSSVALLKLSTGVCNRLMVEFLRSPFFYIQMRGFMKGAAITRVTLKRMAPALIPLPPLAEQHRIVAKVDELMALCDCLEAAQTERESRRDRLAVAVHASVSNFSFHSPHSTFLINHLPDLTTKPQHIQQLRQTILNLAVRGQLVPQDLNDEPATLLLERLAADAKAYANEQGTARPNLESIREESIAFLAPSGWEWVRLSSLFKVITDGDHQPPPKTERGIAFLTIGNITTGRLDFSNCRFVAKEYLDSLAAYRKPIFGDILYTVVGATYGRPAYVDSKREFCVQRHIAILKPTDEMNVRFLCLLLASPLVFEQATRSTTGTAQPTIPLRPLRNFIVPLPPLAEQYRIVAKVDELMALCDRLKAQLTTAQTECRRLLEAVLHEALAPVA